MVGVIGMRWSGMAVVRRRDEEREERDAGCHGWGGGDGTRWRVARWDCRGDEGMARTTRQVGGDEGKECGEERRVEMESHGMGMSRHWTLAWQSHVDE